MSPHAYATAIARLGLSQRSAARFLGVDERTSRRYISGASPVPATVAKLIEAAEEIRRLKAELAVWQREWPWQSRT